MSSETTMEATLRTRYGLAEDVPLAKVPAKMHTVRLLEIEIRLSTLASQFLKCNVKSDAQPASFYL